MLEGVIWNELSDKRKNIIVRKTKKTAKKYKNTCTAHKGIKVRMKFSMTKMMHQAVAKKEKTLSADNQYWVDKGWIKI